MAVNEDKLNRTLAPPLIALALAFLVSGPAFVSTAHGQALEQGFPTDLAGFGEAFMPGSSEIPFSVSARVALSRSEPDVALDETFSVEIVPLEDGTGTGPASRAPPIPDWSLATLTGIEASVEARADYHPFRGESEYSAAGRKYSWVELLGRGEEIAWEEGSRDNETLFYSDEPRGVGQALEFERTVRVREAVGHAEVRISLRPSQREIRAQGRVVARAEGGDLDHGARAEATAGFGLRVRESVSVTLANCALFEPDGMASLPGVRNFIDGGDTCTFEFRAGPAECAIVFEGTGGMALGELVIVDATNELPGVVVYDRTDRTNEARMNEIVLGSSEFADPAFRDLAAAALANIMAPPDAALTVRLAGALGAEGSQSVTILHGDGSAEIFEFEFGSDASNEELDATVNEVLGSLRDQLGQACPQ